PNVHIDDLAELYVKLLDYPDELVGGQIFNAGYENHTVSDLAQMAKSVVEREFPDRLPVRVETTSTKDNRSYHVSSRRIAEKLRFRPKRTIEDAIHDLCSAFHAGKFPDSLSNDNYVNVKTVKKLALH